MRCFFLKAAGFPPLSCQTPGSGGLPCARAGGVGRVRGAWPILCRASPWAWGPEAWKPPQGPACGSAQGLGAGAVGAGPPPPASGGILQGRWGNNTLKTDVAIFTLSCWTPKQSQRGDGRQWSVAAVGPGFPCRTEGWGQGACGVVS